MQDRSTGTARSVCVRPTEGSSPIDAADGNIEHRVGHYLRRAYYRAKANTGAKLQHLKITPTQASAIMALARHEELSQAELGRTIGMEPANVHSLLDRLTALRYIKLGAHPADQRQVRVRLTVFGEKRAAEISMLAARSSQETLAPLDAAERATFLSLLVRIALE